MKNQPLKLIIIGCKDVSVNVLNELHSFNQISIVGAYDANHLMSLAFCKDHEVEQIKHFEDIQKIDFDAVAITTTSDSHFGLCQFFIENNKYIFCEAPLIRNIDQYNYINKLSQSKKNLIYTFSLDKGGPVLTKIKEIIKKKTYGTINDIHINLSINSKNFIFKNITLISSLSSKLSHLLSCFGQYNIGDIETSKNTDDHVTGLIATDEYNHFEFELSWAKSIAKNSITLMSDTHKLHINLEKNFINIIQLKNSSKKTKIKFPQHQSGLRAELQNFIAQINNPSQNHNPLLNELDCVSAKLRTAS